MPNTINPLLPKLVARGLLALRQESRMPRLVNRGYEATPGTKFSTVTIPVPVAVAVNDVTPAATPPATADTVLGEKSIVVDQWKEAAFYLSDQDMTRIDAEENFLPMQASEAIKAIANTIDNYIWDKMYKATYGFAGTAGTTPFATDTSAYQAARRVLNDQLCPPDPRYCVINTAAEEKALGLRAFQDASFSGSIDGIVNGQINNKLGARWMMSQNTPRHVAGTASGATTNNAGYAIGVKTVTLASAGTGTILVGDIVTFAGQTQTYVVTSGDADVSNGGTISFEPGLVAAIPASNTAITLKASHAVNMLFHPLAFAFVNKPFAGTDPFDLGKFFSMVDPVSGLALRVEVTREYKRTRFAYDALYGGEMIRREFATRLAGE